MAFGYEILHGRQGVTGHCREINGKTVVQARGFQPGESCNGQAVLTCAGGGPVFVVSGDKVLLWQGGEENYLRACDWIKREQKKTGETQKDASPDNNNQQPEPENPRSILVRDLEEIQLEPVKAESVPEAPDPEPAYTLRPAGTGEPVDTLPG